MQHIRRLVLVALSCLTLSLAAEDKIYSGHYASGIAKYVVSKSHVYTGNYAAGISSWTYSASSDVLHVYQGHYASGISKFTYRNGHLYLGHYASGISAWTLAESSGVLHIYKGHYASGISKFSVKDGHVYKGHYAAGISAWTFKTTDETPDGLLAFLVTQLLLPEEVEDGPSSRESVDPVPPRTDPDPRETVDPVRPPADPEPREAVYPQPPSSHWARSRTLRGVFEENGAVIGTVEVKCGKANRSGLAGLSVTIIPFNGKKTRFRTKKVAVDGPAAAAEWDGLDLSIAGDGFSAELDSSRTLRSAPVGNPAFADGRHLLSVAAVGEPAALEGYVLDESVVPAEVPFDVRGRKWSFDRKDPAKIRLTYTPKTGCFKGSFKLRYLRTDNPRRKRTVSVKVAGVLIDGHAVGLGTVARPARTFAVSAD